MQRTEDLNVKELIPLPPPNSVKSKLGATETHVSTVVRGRTEVKNILSNRDSRLLIVLGPCSIHDPDGALDYARRLKEVAEEISSQVVVIMRVYFEKPRTTVGWKGLINDPHLDGSCDVEAGLKLARQLLLHITALGLPVATEFLDPIIPQYIGDLVSWAAIGARTTESQTHRELASGLSMPVGYKNGTDGSLQVALDAMTAARSPHSFLGMDPQGKTCVVRTKGNPCGHVILRGGRSGSNYDEASLNACVDQLQKANLPTGFMVDCSHANSAKKFARQEVVWNEVLQQRLQGNRNIVGLMVESNLEEGSQPLQSTRSALRYGVSITDPCIGWQTTARLLRKTFEMLRKG